MVGYWTFLLFHEATNLFQYSMGLEGGQSCFRLMLVTIVFRNVLVYEFPLLTSPGGCSVHNVGGQRAQEDEMESFVRFLLQQCGKLSRSYFHVTSYNSPSSWLFFYFFLNYFDYVDLSIHVFLKLYARRFVSLDHEDICRCRNLSARTLYATVTYAD